MTTKKKKQHYVWEFYLKGWGVNNQVWCRRNEKVFLSSTENVAQERYFYETKSLTDAEIELLRNMMRKGPVINQITNLSSLDVYIRIANSTGDFSRYGLEEYHSMIENKAISVMTALRSGDDTVLKDKQSKIDLCIYLGHQYTRTKKSKNSFVPLSQETDIPEKYAGCDLVKVHHAASFVFAAAIGNAMCNHLDLKLVKNESSTNLLTCDQPIYNLRAVPGKEAKDSSFYFPLSPSLALWAKKDPNIEVIDFSNVKKLNSFMVNNSYELVFAYSEEELSGISSLV